MNKTSNYQLCQWDGEDRILRTDFNEDNAKIDAALKQQANSIAGINSTLPGKADAATVTSLSAQLSTEIQNRQSADTAEATARAQADTAESSARIQADNTEKAAREAADTAEAQARAQAISAEAAARTAALALKGNCQIYYTTYVGDSAATKTLSFPGKPLLVNVQGDNLIGQGLYGTGYFMIRTSGTGGYACRATWNGNSLTWSISTPMYGCNVSGETYLVIALMAMDE